MKILIIVSSHRVESNSLRVAQRFQEVATKLSKAGAEILDLRAENIPIWSEDMYQPDSEEYSQWESISTRVLSAEAFVLITPEYSGMASPMLMNFLMKCSGAETGHKPALLVGLSSGLGGTYPLAQMRQFGSKNNFLCFVPFGIIVRNANDMLHDSKPQHEEDRALMDRMEYGLKLLVGYGTALSHMRSSIGLDFNRYIYGV